jgi:hypothetical protein
MSVDGRPAQPIDEAGPMLGVGRELAPVGPGRAVQAFVRDCLPRRPFRLAGCDQTHLSEYQPPSQMPFWAG